MLPSALPSYPALSENYQRDAPHQVTFRSRSTIQRIELLRHLQRDSDIYRVAWDKTNKTLNTETLLTWQDYRCCRLRNSAVRRNNSIKSSETRRNMFTSHGTSTDFRRWFTLENMPNFAASRETNLLALNYCCIRVPPRFWQSSFFLRSHLRNIRCIVSKPSIVAHNPSHLSPEIQHKAHELSMEEPRYNVFFTSYTLR